MKTVIAKSRSGLNKKSSRKIAKTPSLEVIDQADQILKLPPQLFSPYRLVILFALWAEGQLDFKRLLESVPKITEGNLSGHLKKLEELKLIDIEKEFIKKKPRTLYKLNDYGVEQYNEFVDTIKKSLKDVGTK